MTHVLLAGFSTRAAAESAVRAGFRVTTIDAFHDIDLDRAVQGFSLPRDFGTGFTAVSAARAAGTMASDAVAYLSSFENHPRAVRALAAGRVLWGNPPEVLARVRDPQILADCLTGRRLAAPAYVVSGFSTAVALAEAVSRTVDGGRRWLLKPRASGGGRAIRPWIPGTDVPRGCYLQELIEGTPGSVVFVAAAGRAVPLGISRQIVGDEAFGAGGYRYCGNILAAAGDPQFARDETLVERASAVAQAVTEEFGLVGVNGIDFVASDGIPYTLEVNPRWCGSMELVERVYGLSVFGAHAAACASGAVPEFDLTQARRGIAAAARSVVFARKDLTLGDTREWLTDATVRDVPHPGGRVSAGQPICTVFATGSTAAACYAALVERAERVYRELMEGQTP